MDTITRLTKALTKLYPSGKAFKLFSTQWKNLNVALLAEPVDIRAFMVKVRDSGIPGRLPSEALEDWEELFQFQGNATLTDDERNARIKARYDAVGGQGLDYLQDVLRGQFDLLLGTYTIFTETCGNPTTTCGNPDSTCGSFINSDSTATITVYENNPPWENPAFRLGILIVKTENDLPSLIPGLDQSEYWGPFWFISGPDGLGSFLELPLDRKSEFIEAVLRIKPVDSWVVAQINFV